MEIIGLVIILLLVVLGLLFFAYSNQRKANTKQDVVDTQMSQALLNAMMQSKTDCGPELYRAIQDCYDKNDLCDGNSCEYAKTKVSDILAGTLGKWKKPYQFFTDREGDKKIEFSDSCNVLSEKLSTGLYFIQDDDSTIIISLNICKI